MGTIDPWTAGDLLESNTKEKSLNDQGLAYNNLVKFETAAVNAYTLVQEKFESDEAKSVIDQNQFNHKSHVDYLTKRALAKRKTPDSDYSPWNTALGLIIKSTKLIGETPLLTSLREAEEFGVREYRSSSVSHKPSIDDIETEIIPNLKSNVEVPNKILRQPKSP